MLKNQVVEALNFEASGEKVVNIKFFLGAGATKDGVYAQLLKVMPLLKLGALKKTKPVEDQMPKIDIDTISRL